MTIWKYPLKIQSEQSIEAPIEFVPLSIQMQDGTPTLWALVDEVGPRGIFPILMVGPGWTGERGLINGDLHLGTVQDGKFEWHYFLMGIKVK